MSNDHIFMQINQILFGKQRFFFSLSLSLLSFKLSQLTFFLFFYPQPFHISRSSCCLFFPPLLSSHLLYGLRSVRNDYNNIIINAIDLNLICDFRELYYF